MAKYDVNFKLAVVNDYLAGVGGYRTLGEKYTIDRSMVRKWVNAYNLLGRAGLERKNTKDTSFKELKTAIDKFIIYYNYERMKSKLNWQSPVTYREQYKQAA